MNVYDIFTKKKLSDKKNSNQKELVEIITMASVDSVADLEFKDNLTDAEERVLNIFTNIGMIQDSNPLFLSGFPLTLSKEEKVLATLITVETVVSLLEYYFDLLKRENISKNENKFVNTVKRIDTQSRELFETYLEIAASIEAESDVVLEELVSKMITEIV